MNIVQVDLDLLTLLPQPNKCWHYRLNHHTRIHSSSYCKQFLQDVPGTVCTGSLSETVRGHLGVQLVVYNLPSISKALTSNPRTQIKRGGQGIKDVFL